MKILLVNKYHYVKGGSETYYFGLADLLTKLGHEVIYFSMADSNNKPCEQEKYFVSNVDFNSNISTLQKVKAGFRVLYSFEAKKIFLLSLNKNILILFILTLFTVTSPFRLFGQ